MTEIFTYSIIVTGSYSGKLSCRRQEVPRPPKKLGAREFVVIADEGGKSSGPSGGSYIAFTLPMDSSTEMI